MAQVDNGPATGNASFFFGSTAGVEFHAQIGANSLAPSDAPFVDPSIASTLQTQVNKSNFVAGVGLKFVNPA